MTGTVTRTAAILGLLLWLAACAGSPPSNFYRLTAATAPAGGNQQPALGIGPVDIPGFLKRDALVYSGGGNRLHVAGGERWAEPLEDGIQRVLGLNLAQLLNSENLRFFPWDSQQAPDYAVKINVLDLDASDGQATLVVDWLLYRPGSGVTISQRISRLHAPLVPAQLSPAALPPAYSALLYQLAETIARAIRADQEVE